MSEDSKVVKASMNNETAASTERHNDRDMYEKKDGRYDVSKNIHWDCYGCGSSFLAEEQFYNTNFSSVLEAQNDRYLKQRHPEKVMSMDEYHRKHMPQEMIFQIGNLQNQEQGIGIDDSWCKEAIPKVVEKLESAGCKVISYDLHNDEATPHVHLRYCPIDSKGEVNMSNCLYEHGVMPPDVSKLEYRKNGKPKFTRFNNPKQTLINEVRAKLEELGHEWCAERGLILDDQNRIKRKHQTVNEYKREQLRKDVAKLEDTIEEQQTKIALNESIADEYVELAYTASESSFKANEDAVSAKAEEQLAKQKKEELESDSEVLAEANIKLQRAFFDSEEEYKVRIEQQNQGLRANHEEQVKELEANFAKREKELVSEYNQKLHDLEVQTNAANRHLEYIKGVADGQEERAVFYQKQAKERRHKSAIAGEELSAKNRMIETRRNRKRELDKAIKDSEKIIDNVNAVIEELERTPNIVRLFNAFLESMNRNGDMNKISRESHEYLEAVTLASVGEPFEDFFRKIKQKWQAAKQSFQNKREKVVKQDIASQPYEDSRSFGD